MESRATEILVGNIIPQVFSTVVVVARIITKAAVVKTWGADDSVLVLAWAVSHRDLQKIHADYVCSLLHFP